MEPGTGWLIDEKFMDTFSDDEPILTVAKGRGHYIKVYKSNSYYYVFDYIKGFKGNELTIAGEMYQLTEKEYQEIQRQEG